MSNSFRKIFFVVLMIGSLVAPPNLRPQQPIRNDLENILTVAHDFLRMMYPEEFSKNLTLTFSTSQPADSSWRQIFSLYFNLGQSKALLPQTQLNCEPSDTSDLLAGYVWFNQSGHLHQMAVGNCQIVSYKENESIRRQLETHPKWNSAQIVKAYRDAGAEFGPESKEKFLKAVHLERFQRFIGRFKVESVEFQGLDQISSGTLGTLAWSVKLDVSAQSDSPDFYVLLFEPFHGKLKNVSHGITGVIDK